MSQTRQAVLCLAGSHGSLSQSCSLTPDVLNAQVYGRMQELQKRHPWAIFSNQGLEASCGWCAQTAAVTQNLADQGTPTAKLWWSTPGQTLPENRDFWEKSFANVRRSDTIGSSQ